MTYDVIIAGGGASGLACAIICGRRGLKTAIIEAGDRVGKKLLVTGNGRCNFTNIDMDIGHYSSGSINYVNQIISKYGPNEIMEFFLSLGVASRDKSGLVYPLSNQASSVVDALRFAAGKYADIYTGSKINECRKAGAVFKVKTDSDAYECKNLVIAAGGMAYDGGSSGFDILSSFGHSIEKPYPALVQLKTGDGFIKGLKGCKYTGGINAVHEGKVIRRETGEILFTDYGVSGIAVMQLSYLYSVYEKLTLEMDFIIDIGLNDAKNILISKRDLFKNTGMHAEDILTGLVNKKIGIRILQACGFKPSEGIESLTDDDIGKIARRLKSTYIGITGHNGFKNAQVCGGGADFTGFDINTLESHAVKGLYAIGEVLDVIGDCGGYNLHFAWASAMYAGNSIYKQI